MTARWANISDCTASELQPCTNSTVQRVHGRHERSHGRCLVTACGTRAACLTSWKPRWNVKRTGSGAARRGASLTALELMEYPCSSLGRGDAEETRLTLCPANLQAAVVCPPTEICSNVSKRFYTEQNFTRLRMLAGSPWSTMPSYIYIYATWQTSSPERPTYSMSHLYKWAVEGSGP